MKRVNAEQIIRESDPSFHQRPDAVRLISRKTVGQDCVTPPVPERTTGALKSFHGSMRSSDLCRNLAGRRSGAPGAGGRRGLSRVRGAASTALIHGGVRTTPEQFPSGSLLDLPQ